MKSKIMLVLIIFVLAIRPAFAGSYFGYDMGIIETDVDGNKGEEFGADNLEATLKYGFAFGQKINLKIGSDIDLNIGSHQGGFRRMNYSAGQSNISTILPALFTIRPNIDVSAYLRSFVVGFAIGLPYTSFTGFANDIRVEAWRGSGKLSKEYYIGISPKIRRSSRGRIEVLLLYRQEKYSVEFNSEKFDIENKKIALAFKGYF